MNFSKSRAAATGCATFSGCRHSSTACSICRRMRRISGQRKGFINQHDRNPVTHRVSQFAGVAEQFIMIVIRDNFTLALWTGKNRKKIFRQGHIAVSRFAGLHFCTLMFTSSTIGLRSCQMQIQERAQLVFVKDRILRERGYNVFRLRISIRAKFLSRGFRSKKRTAQGGPRKLRESHNRQAQSSEANRRRRAENRHGWPLFDKHRIKFQHLADGTLMIAPSASCGFY